MKMTNRSENYLLGISDFFFVNSNKKSKDRRNSAPAWMKFKLHQKEWQEGWDYASKQTI